MRRCPDRASERGVAARIPGRANSGACGRVTGERTRIRGTVQCVPWSGQEGTGPDRLGRRAPRGRGEARKSEGDMRGSAAYDRGGRIQTGMAGLARQPGKKAVAAHKTHIGARRSALGARRSALGARRSALGARRSALGARRSALGALLYCEHQPYVQLRSTSDSIRRFVDHGKRHAVSLIGELIFHATGLRPSAGPAGPSMTLAEGAGRVWAGRPAFS